MFKAKPDLSLTLFSLFLAALLAAPAAAAPPQGDKLTGWTCSAEECKQDMLTLAFAADLSASLVGDLQPITSTTTARVKCLLASALGSDWSLEWGPALMLQPTPKNCSIPTPPGKTPANTMLVAKRNGSEDYVVAVAGTNLRSGYDWCTEDLNITPVAWNSDSLAACTPATGGPINGAGYVTEGTCKGLNNLKVLQAADNSTLLQYLKSAITSPNSTVYVTGHSLGGALAPAAGLWLKNIQSTWDPGSNATVKVYAFAGPTPGDQRFASYVNGQLIGDQLVVVNNTNDVVPYAWNELEEIQGLYNSKGINPDKIAGLTQELELLVDTVIYGFGSNYPGSTFTYTTLGSSAQQQSFAEPLVDPASWPTTICPTLTTLEPTVKKLFSNTGDQNFALEAAYQHDCGYPIYLNLLRLPQQFATCVASHPLSPPLSVTTTKASLVIDTPRRQIRYRDVEIGPGTTVIGLMNKAKGLNPPLHFQVVDPSGACIVESIEGVRPPAGMRWAFFIDGYGGALPPCRFTVSQAGSVIGWKIIEAGPTGRNAVGFWKQLSQFFRGLFRKSGS